MKNYCLGLPQNSRETLTGALWLLATATAIAVFLLVSWLGIQRGEIITDRCRRAIAERQRDTAIRERDAAIKSCNERLARAEAARSR